jgi:signal transduction histidine kinase
METLSAFFDATGFMPHGHCFLWTPSLLWALTVSDSLIGLSYLSIPAAIWTFKRRRHDLPFGWIFVLFSAFIFACGATHLIAVWEIWHPAYALDASVKSLTAILSVLTAAVLWPLIPRALAIPSRTQLAQVNRNLQSEIGRRVAMETQLLDTNRSLDARIAARTAELERINDELRDKNRQLERSNRDLEDFAYIASHDLKTPLSGIKSAALWLEEDLRDLSEGSKELLRLMRSRINRMEKLLDDLLTFSRVGRTDTALGETRVAEIVENIIEVLQPPAHIPVRVDGELPVIFTAGAQLEQVLRNLVNNAIKHHDKKNGEVVVSGKRIGDIVEFDVRDDGPGIPPEFHERIFQLFQTLKRRDEVEGSGMGLAIVKRLVERQNCRIAVYSQGDGTGTRFHFNWPALPPGARAAEPPNA